MSYLKKIIKCFYDSEYRHFVLLKIVTLCLKPDSLYLKLLFRRSLGYRLNLKNPQTFNEKLQWLKLHNRKPEYTVMVDKIKAKEYVADLIGEEYIIPTLGVWDRPEDIDYDSLPDKFVLKCNHNSGEGMYICKDKSKIDVAAVNEGLRKGLKYNYYIYSREWPYKNVERRILAEEYIEDDNNSNSGLLDYKIYCFNGTPKFLYVGKTIVGINSKELLLTFYNFDWTKPPFYRKDHLELPFATPKPEKIDEMFEIAAKISYGIPFLRVDLYYVNGRVFFSENTFYPGGGFSRFYPDEWEKKLGEWIVINDEIKQK